MMGMASIRNGVVKGLYEHIGCPVVPTDTVDRKPDYPYISYKITSSHDTSTFSLADEIAESTNPSFEHDVLTTRIEQPQLTLSINAYSNNDDEAYTLAAKARDWFTYHGDLFFVGLNIVIIKAANITDRTHQVVDDFERRYGFDVRIRAARAITKRVETIESFDLGGIVYRPFDSKQNPERRD